MLCALRHRQAALCAVHAMRIDCPGPYESVCTTSGLRSSLLSIPYDLSLHLSFPSSFGIRTCTCVSFRISVPSIFHIPQSERKIYKKRVDSPGLGGVQQSAVKDRVLRGTLKEYRANAREQTGPSRAGPDEEELAFFTFCESSPFHS